MKKIFDGYLILTDCDGTLCNSQGTVSSADVEAIVRFQNEGGLFTLATGRFPSHVEKFQRLFRPNTLAVMGNGTTLYDAKNDTIVEQIVLDPVPEEVVLFVVKEGLSRLIFVDHTTYSVMWKDESLELSYPEDPLQKKVKTIEELFGEEAKKRFGEPWHKVNFCFDTPEKNICAQTILRERFPMYRFERSWATGLELLPFEGGKGNAVRRLRTRLGDSVRVIAAVGDYENDADMLREADIGYAVNNAAPVCKEAADRITKDHDHDPISAVIADIERQIVVDGSRAKGYHDNDRS